MSSGPFLACSGETSDRSSPAIGSAVGHVRELAVGVWPEPQLPETVLFGSKSELK
jgi:hypothetical protein